MATYPLKNIAIGSDTYEIKSGGGYQTLTVTGTKKPDEFKQSTSFSQSNLAFTDEEGNSITLGEFLDARYTKPSRVIYICTANNIKYCSYCLKFTETTSTVSLVAPFTELAVRNNTTKQATTAAIYLTASGTQGSYSLMSVSGYNENDLVTYFLPIVDTNFPTVEAFANDIIAGTTTTYSLSGNIWFYKEGITSIWEAQKETRWGNMDFGIYLPTPKASFKAVSKWIDNNDYYFIIYLYNTYTVGSDTHKGLIPVLGKLVFDTGSSPKLTGVKFERMYTANN